MFAFPSTHRPQATFHLTSTMSARATYEQELERLAFLTQQHEQQRRRAQAAAREAALAAYAEEQERRHREEAFERAVQQEVARRRQAALVQEALEHRAALARRAQQEREAAAYRQAVVEAAQRRAALVAREQHRRRVEAEQDQRRRVVEARRQQQRQRQSELPQSLLQLFLDLATSAAQDEQPAVAAPAPAVADKAARTSSSTAPAATAPRPPSPAAEPTFPDPAIEALQKRFERDAARQAALETLNGLSTEFDSRLSSFTSPSTLTFQSPPTPTSTPSTPPLAYGKPNAAFLGHEDYLVSLLSKVDAVSSGGDKVIKQARKDLVKRVEAELAKLDHLKEHEWERQSQKAASEAGEGSVRGHEDIAAAAPSPSAAAAIAEPEPAIDEPATATAPSSASALDNSTSAALDTPLDESTRLTAELLASLPTAAATPSSTLPRPRSRASTTSHASDTSSAVDRYVAEMLRRAKELAARIDAEEEVERAAASAPSASEAAQVADEASATPSALESVIDVERAGASAPSTALDASEPLEDGVDEEIDVEATLRLKRSSSAAPAAPASAVSATDEATLRPEEPAREREAEEEAVSEAGTEEFLVV
ncbi:hypothetical protein JCM9279_003617 [Rhodotorula babjevae]